MRVEWGKRQCLDWWRAALRYPVTERAGCYVCHPVSHLAWTSSTGLPLPPQWMSQLEGSHAPREFNAPAAAMPNVPSLLSFPGAAGINSATRTMALEIDWAHVCCLTAELELETASAQRCFDEPLTSRTVDAVFNEVEGHWQAILSRCNRPLWPAPCGALGQCQESHIKACPTGGGMQSRAGNCACNAAASCGCATRRLSCTSMCWCCFVGRRARCHKALSRFQTSRDARAREIRANGHARRLAGALCGC